LSSWIEEKIKNIAGDDLSNKVFCDIFAGTGTIGRVLKSQVKTVISNDLEYYSYILNKNYIENSEELTNKEYLIEELNNSPLIDNGFIYNNYCIGSGSGRNYFKDSNAKKIDTIRIKIEEWKNQNKISYNIYYFLLTSLLESTDRVANTASIYGSFLKKIKNTAQNDLLLESANFEITSNNHKVYNQDANELIKNIQADILYLDPPYNQRQYGANYHLLNTIALYDDFIPKGKTGVRVYNRSNYCKRKKVAHSFEDLIKNANCQYIFLSYNNEGLMGEETIRKIMKKYGKYHLEKKEYKRFKADKTENRNHKASITNEYLHVLEKNG
jgi:adenine-specific DNA-methyltransferase